MEEGVNIAWRQRVPNVKGEKGRVVVREGIIRELGLCCMAGEKGKFQDKALSLLLLQATATSVIQSTLCPSSATERAACLGVHKGC